MLASQSDYKDYCYIIISFLYNTFEVDNKDSPNGDEY